MIHCYQNCKYDSKYSINIVSRIHMDEEEYGFVAFHATNLC